MADRRASLSASSCSLGSSPVWRNRTVCCAHAGAWGSTARTKGISSAIGALPRRQELDAPPELAVPWRAQCPRQRPCRRLRGSRRESTCRALISSSYSALLMDQWMAELAEAQRYLVPQVA